MTKVAIIGSGFVGSTAAYAMMIKQTASEIVIVDIDKEKAEGQAMDLEHGMQFVPGSKITYGDEYSLCKDADVIVITAGLAQKPGETRLDLVKKNAAVFKEMIPKIVEQNNKAVFLIISNPVDIMTYLTIKYSGLPKTQVIGSGTSLDTARLRHYLGEEFGISPHSVHAYIFGEHGDSEFPVWSRATVGGQRIYDMNGFDREHMDEIFRKTKNAAYEIIAKKGSTYYAIGLVIEQIVNVIINDENLVLPVSVYLNNYYDVGDVCLSIPCIVGRGGIKKKMQLPLNEEEQDQLRTSSRILKEIIGGIE
ncbi:MAG: L-lactate dehydrogenase [Candidatus Nanoarchaeia archaeon]